MRLPTDPGLREVSRHSPKKLFDRPPPRRQGRDVLYPVVLGFGLSEEERRIAEFWLASGGNPRVPSFLRPGELGSGLNAQLGATSPDLAACLEWQVPVLVCAGAGQSKAQLDEFFRAGVAAVWTPRFLAEGSLLLPPLKLPQSKRSVFVVTDDDNQRRLLRQLFTFTGYDLRSDFRSGDEMIEVLRGLHEGGGPQKAFPELLVLDLDSRRVDVPGFFHKLRTLRSEHPALVRRTRVLITKDFQKPGADVRTLGANLRSFAKRIYHPLEAAFVFLEGLVYRDEQTPWHYRSPAYRPVAEILFGDSAKLSGVSPTGSIESLARETARFQRGLLFLELHDFLVRWSREGAVLAPQPDVDAGDLLHGVRGPHSSGMGLKHTGE